MSRLLWLCLLGPALLLAGPARANTDLFTGKVAPLLQGRCLACHGRHGQGVGGPTEISGKMNQGGTRSAVLRPRREGPAPPPGPTGAAPTCEETP